MWLLFGVIAILATFINLYLYKTGKSYSLAVAIGLAFTALTLVTSYNMIFDYIKVEDWSALLDVVPTMTRVFWVLTGISILLNMAPIFLELKKNKNRKINRLVL